MRRARQRLITFSVDHPAWVIGVATLISLAFAFQFPQIVIDTDPKHMLPVTSPVRQYNDQVERDFGLHADVIVLGIVNPHGIANPTTLARIVDLTGRIQHLPGVIARDVTSLSTIDDITSVDGDLAVHAALADVPNDEWGCRVLREEWLSNPLFIGRIISGDGVATAIYIPIEPGANGRQIADGIRQLLPSDRAGDQFHLAGDPVARDTFGTEMFQQMGLFSPIAGLVICLMLWFLFRNVALVIANMAVAMISIVWSMGLLIGLGIPVHIMASMSPVFLMAIATDSVHIFNEFAFRFGETGNQRQAIFDTMSAVSRPIAVSDLATAVGFASLATAPIIPVKIFGLVVAFGTLVILLLSFTLVPAILILLRPEHIPVIRQTREETRSLLARLGGVCIRRARTIAIVGGVVLAVAAFGITRIRVNNNMIHWFKPGSAVRTADRVMNEHLGGTSTGYLVVGASADDAMKDPVLLRGIEGLQRELEHDPRVGKTFSVVDYVRRINYVLHGDDPAFDRIPDSADAVGQYLFLFSMSAKPSDLENVVDYPYRTANIFLQLKSWDADVMRAVIARTNAYLSTHPLPNGAVVRPAGIAHFNMIWSDEVLWGMLESFLAGLVLVLILLVAETRSFLWGTLIFLPLLFTIALLYGVVGLIGKDFDMPVAVLSTLSLGLATDFAIHFVARFRARYREDPDLGRALVWTVARPGRGIFLNALLFAAGFAVMVFADLTPYITVGVFMVAIMLLSALLSVVFLPGLIHLFRRTLLKGEVNA
ncbi:MAG: MMPL family transporter [candidate division Zixibacteria bacterium]|nr:MMPL family transporter [candidate division Zixibacteria bacterium]